MNELVTKFFKKKEVLSVENFYKYFSRKKIIIFVPFNFLEKLTIEMFDAGAGLIGNYEMCSFRTEGTGTFKPNDKAKPFSGRKKSLSYVEEVKLEMECGPNNVNKVIDAFQKNHPYDEPAYEIYDFKKRDKKAIGFVINLKSKIKYKELFKRLNPKLEPDNLNSKTEIKRLAMTSAGINENIFESARFINCDCLFLISKNNYKLFKI